MGRCFISGTAADDRGGECVFSLFYVTQRRCCQGRPCMESTLSQCCLPPCWQYQDQCEAAASTALSFRGTCPNDICTVHARLVDCVSERLGMHLARAELHCILPLCGDSVWLSARSQRQTSLCFAFRRRTLSLHSCHLDFYSIR